MNALQNVKLFKVTSPAALVDDASLAFDEIDTLGWDYVTIVVMIGATDIACTACILTEGDTSGSGHANITASNFDGQTEADGTTAALPGATDDDGFFAWELDLRKRKRYIDATITVGDGTAGGYYTVFAILSKGFQPPTGISARGFKGLIRL